MNRPSFGALGMLAVALFLLSPSPVRAGDLIGVVRDRVNVIVGF